MIKKREPGVRYKASAEKEIARWSDAIAKMSWQEMAEDLLEMWEENEKVVIGEYSSFHDFDNEVLKRKVELYRARISELAAL
jgi:hypothetical protein